MAYAEFIYLKDFKRIGIVIVMDDGELVGSAAITPDDEGKVSWKQFKESIEEALNEMVRVGEKVKGEENGVC